MVLSLLHLRQDQYYQENGLHFKGSEDGMHGVLKPWVTATTIELGLPRFAT